jgi:hypothetical protein
MTCIFGTHRLEFIDIGNIKQSKSFKARQQWPTEQVQQLE